MSSGLITYSSLEPGHTIDLDGTREAIRDEREYREKRTFSGVADTWVAVHATGASVVAEKMQTEAEQAKGLGVYEPTHTLYDVLATMPADAKALGVAAGTYALVAAFRRGREKMTFDADPIGAVTWRSGGDVFTPPTAESRRRSRVGRWLGDIVVGGLAATGSYYAAKHGTVMEDGAVMLGLDAAAVAALTVPRLKRRSNRRQNAK